MRICFTCVTVDLHVLVFNLTYFRIPIASTLLTYSPSGVPACPSDINVVEGGLCDSVNVTWTSSPSQIYATITYCQVSSQGSCMSVVCSSSPCTIQGVRREREYEYTVLPISNCGRASGCIGNTFTFALGEF